MDVSSANDKAVEGGGSSSKWGGLMVGELAPLRDEAYQERPPADGSQSPEELQFTDDTLVFDEFESVGPGGGEADFGPGGIHSDYFDCDDGLGGGSSSHHGGGGSRARTMKQHQAHSIVFGGIRMSHSAHDNHHQEDEENSSSGHRRRRKPNLPTPSKRPKEASLAHQPQQTEQQSTTAAASSTAEVTPLQTSDRRKVMSKENASPKPTKKKKVFNMSSSSKLTVGGRRRLFASSKTLEIPAGDGDGESNNNNNNNNNNNDRELDESHISENVVEKVDPTKTSVEPSSAREYAFVISVGILMAFNMGFVNGACLSGFLVQGTRQGVAGYTNPYSDSALRLAEGNYYESKFQTCMIACFIGGSFISGAMTPNAVPYRIEPTYGPSFLVSALCLGVATILAATTTNYNDDFVFYLAGTASGIQNGISSSYTAKLIRSTGLTGSSTDIGLYLGQVVRGNKENKPKLIVLIMLAIAFWCGGLISFYTTRHFTSLALLFSTVLFLIIGLSLMIFLVVKLNISFRAAMLGTWQWQAAVEKIQGAFEELLDMSGSHLNAMSDRELEEIFDRIDIDNSGTIDSEELYILLRSTGVKISREESDAMLKFADKDKDGVLSKEEWKNAIHTAMTPKKSVMRKVSLSTRNLMATTHASTRNLMTSTRDLMGGQRKSNPSSSGGSSSQPRSVFSFGGHNVNKSTRSTGSVASANELWNLNMMANSSMMGRSYHSDPSGHMKHSFSGGGGEGGEQWIEGSDDGASASNEQSMSFGGEGSNSLENLQNVTEM